MLLVGGRCSRGPGSHPVGSWAWDTLEGQEVVCIMVMLLFHTDERWRQRTVLWWRGLIHGMEDLHWHREWHCSYEHLSYWSWFPTLVIPVKICFFCWKAEYHTEDLGRKRWVYQMDHILVFSLIFMPWGVPVSASVEINRHWFTLAHSLKSSVLWCWKGYQHCDHGSLKIILVEISGTPSIHPFSSIRREVEASRSPWIVGQPVLYSYFQAN